MANLSNINNILRVSSSGVGLNKNNTGPSELDIESSGADMIDMTRTGQKTYRFAISGASAFSLFDVAANADRLTIDTSGNATFAGNVTVGNSGNINIPTAASGNANLHFDGTDFKITSNSSSANLKLETNSTTRLTIGSNGLVSLPTTGLNDTRHIIFTGTQGVANNAGNLGMWGNEVRLTGNWYYNGAQQKVVAGNGMGVMGIGVGTTDAACYLTFGVNGPAATGGPTERMRISSSGNVGIGFSAGHDAITKLELPGSLTNSSLKAGTLEMQSYSVNNAWLADNVYYNGAWYLRSNGYASQVYFGSGGDISFKRFATGNAGTVATPVLTMQLDSAGNVGIGKSQSGNAVLTARSSAGGNTGIILIEGDTTDDGWGVYATTANKYIITRFTAGSYSDKFTILEGGNVGIGTDSPGQKLQVNGSIKIANSNSRLVFGTSGGTDRRALEGNTSGSLLQIGESYTDIALQGNVGIGTTGPSSILTVYGGGSTTSTLELRGGASGADNATISTQQSMAFQIGSAGATGRSYTFLSGGLGYGSGTALFSIDSNGGTFNRSWPQTTTSGSSSVVQTTLIPEPGVYEFYLRGNPNVGGSSAYTSVQAGLITIAVDYTPSKSVFLRITKHVTAQDGGGSSNIQLNLNVYMLYNGSASGEQSIANKDQSVIYLTVSGYVGTVGSGQTLRLTRKI